MRTGDWTGKRMLANSWEVDAIILEVFNFSRAATNGAA